MVTSVVLIRKKPRQRRARTCIVILGLCLATLTVLNLFFFIKNNTEGSTNANSTQKFRKLVEAANHKNLLQSSFNNDNISSLLSLFPQQGSNQTWGSEVVDCDNSLRRFYGKIEVSFYSPSFDELALANPGLKPGGSFQPNDCTPAQRTAIIIPYRNREVQLRALLNHLHPILQRQKLDYTIFVVEQEGSDMFNKAFLMNVGFQESQVLSANSSRHYGCYIFHDVDLFIEDDRAIYGCHETPMHLSEYLDKFDYKPYGGTDVLYGGVVSIKRRLFELVNGYTNLFFGWGAEDEEMRMRLKIAKIPIITPDQKYYRYRMFKHDPDSLNPWNDKNEKMLSKTDSRMKYDGLNSLNYTLVQTDLFASYTRFLVRFTKESVYNAVFAYRKASAGNS